MLLSFAPQEEAATAHGSPAIFVFAVLGLLVVVGLAKALHVVPETQRLAVSRLGMFVGIRGPGLVVVVPLIDSFVRYDLGPRELRVSDVAGVDALVRYQILDAEKIHRGVASPRDFLRQAARTAVQQVAGTRPAVTTDVFARQAVRDAMDALTSAYGVKVLEVELVQAV